MDNKEYYQLNKEKIKARTKINSGSVGVQPYRARAKKLCRQLANYTCQICGGEGIDAHHLIPVEQGGSDEQDNLICVCRSCHQKIHHNTLVFEDGEWKYLPLPSRYKRKEDFIERRDYRREIAELKKYFHDFDHPEHIDLEMVHTLNALQRDFKTLSLDEIEKVLQHCRKRVA